MTDCVNEAPVTSIEETLNDLEARKRHEKIEDNFVVSNDKDDNWYVISMHYSPWGDGPFVVCSGLVSRAAAEFAREHVVDLFKDDKICMRTGTCSPWDVYVPCVDYYNTLGSVLRELQSAHVGSDLRQTARRIADAIVEEPVPWGDDGLPF